MATTHWNGPFLQTEFCGPVEKRRVEGLVVQGTVSMSRSHTVFVTPRKGAATHDQADELPTRFTAVVLEQIKHVHRRHFDKYDQELDYQSNLVSRTSRVDLSPISFDNLAALLSGDKTRAVSPKLLEKVNYLHPSKSGAFEFWIDVAKPGAKDLEAGDELRIVTIGPSIFVERWQILNAKAKDELTGGWSNALLVHGERDDTKIDGGDKEGVDDDEWDD